MFIRNCFAVPLAAALAASVLSAASGVLDFRAGDSLTHYPVRAVINGNGPEPFSVTTDARGHIELVLPAGEYRLEISASGYATLRTHYLVEPGRLTKAGALLDPQTVPEEESREVLDPLLRPGFTLLHEYVVDRETGEPLSAVKVRAVNAGVETQTDSKGHFCLSMLTPRPATRDGVGTDTLIYEKPGYKTIIFRNFGIASEEMGPVAVDMDKGSGVIDQDATHKLMRETPEHPGIGQLPPPVSSLSSELYTWLGVHEAPFSLAQGATAADGDTTSHNGPRQH